MEIQTYHISLIILGIQVISQFAINKYQTSQFKEQIGLLFKKYDKNSGEISNLKAMESSFLTNDKADESYVRRKEFEMLEKHLDKRFDNMQNTLNEILTYIKEK